MDDWAKRAVMKNIFFSPFWPKFGNEKFIFFVFRMIYIKKYDVNSGS